MVLVIGIFLFRINMLIQETIIKAGIVDTITVQARVKAYGIFYTVFGSSILISSILINLLDELYVRAHN